MTVEPVDPVSLPGGSFAGFSFELADYRGDGDYPLVEDDATDWLQFTIFQLEDNEGWFAHPSYGPGSITVSGGVADVSLVFGSAGSERIHLRAQVVLVR